MFYRIRENRLYDYAYYRYAYDCLETNIVTQSELDEHPNKVIIENNVLVLNPNYEQEQEQAEQERIANLNLTKADFWIALLDRDITKNMVKEKINLIPDEKLKAKTLIRLDEADHFWRGDAAMDIIGSMFGLTPEDLTYLFENKELPIKEEEPEPNEKE